MTVGFSLFGTAYPFRDLFAARAGRLVAASRLLERSLEESGSALAAANEISALGKEEAAASAGLLRELALVAIRPIERGDVQALDHAFGEAAAAVAAVAVRLSLFRPAHLEGPAQEVAARVTAIAAEVREAVARLGREGPDEASWRRVVKARTDAAGLVAVGLGGLYEEAGEGRMALLEVLAWSQLYDRLEAAVHRTARLADVLHGVLLKQD